jgi:uncharacterized SAM-binding protein YcdF (DUF218 family)
MAKHAPQPNAPRPNRLTTLIWRTALSGLALYAAGLVLFSLALPGPGDPRRVKADAIIALTGEGDRLAPAVRLLEGGRGRRLLITGVNRATTKRDLKALLHGGPAFSCCADLGFAAEDTRGNAEEAAGWMRLHGFRSAIVVTADYHMPRSLIEFETAMPDVELIPYPVVESRGATFGSLRRISGEYPKFLASWVRSTFGPLLFSRPT